MLSLLLLQDLIFQNFANAFLEGWSLHLWSKGISSEPKNVCCGLTCSWVGEEQIPQDHTHKDLQHAATSCSFTILWTMDLLMPSERAMVPYPSPADRFFSTSASWCSV